MTFKTLRKVLWALGAGTAVALLSGMSMTTASAAAVPSTFAAQYSHNAQLEAQLIQKAQAWNGSGTTVTAFSQTVQALDAQVLTLYAAEQALATVRAGIPSGNAGERATLEAHRHTLTKDIAAAKAQMRKDRTAKKSTKERALQLQVKTWTAQLHQAVFQMAHPGVANGSWKSHPLAGGALTLQHSILDLQRAAIHYTELWITAATPSTTAAGNPAAITGLTYASATITVPQAAYAPATDAVAVMPIVTDSQGNVLGDSGSFSIAGPTGSTGVSIDVATGQVSVAPAATEGAYAVTYAQGGITETVDITVAAATPSTAAAGNPATITGLTYASAFITVPQAGSGAATDAVAVMPIVTDSQGNVLGDSGSFSIAGPAGATGVSIDVATGQVSVAPAATGGAYAVTYTQGGITETVDLTVGE